ncbi:hypothetical protein LCGC14_2886100 [marine sediment metagenome]|uniref:Uncharacterized protein n=1 Tax=marine sediment metagenome TaxID=412755 RepID=A0A0F8YKE5_9ZZZZ
MTINNLEHFIASLWDWKILRGCFGNTRIRPTDVDGLVERNHCYLYLEGKTLGSEIPTGQFITYERLASNPRVWVVFFWGDAKAETITSITVLRHAGPKHYDPATLDDLRAIVSRWFVWAERQKAA